jgi:hypothetical protein
MRYERNVGIEKADCWPDFRVSSETRIAFEIYREFIDLPALSILVSRDLLRSMILK